MFRKSKLNHLVMAKFNKKEFVRGGCIFFFIIVLFLIFIGGLGEQESIFKMVVDEILHVTVWILAIFFLVWIISQLVKDIGKIYTSLFKKK